MSAQKALTKTLKFIIKTDGQQEAILNRLTARHTFAIKLYNQIIEREEKIIMPNTYGAEGRLDCLTISTKNHPQVKFDLKEITGLNTVDLQCCGRRALSLWRGYKTQLSKWEKHQESVYYSVFLSKLSDVLVKDNGEIINFQTDFDKEIEEFSQTILWRRIMKNRPSKPFQSQNMKPRKIPAYLRFNQNLIGYMKEGVRYPYKIEQGKLFIKLSTLKEREPIELELICSVYHFTELNQGKLTGGKIIKNIRKKRWEFHAGIKKEITRNTGEEQKAIIGVDLGSKIDATVVVLLEQKKLTQDRIFFFKEPDIRRRKFNLTQRRKVLQNVKDTLVGKERQNAMKELKQISGKIAILTKEGCHRIAKKVALIAKDCVEQGYETHVVLGRLKGLRFSARRGNGKGKKYRGMIHSFPFSMLSQNISYKCLTLGVKNICQINESWTSKTCHRCGSKDTVRPSQASIECKTCGLKYHADVNGAINIALKYWVLKACSNCHKLMTCKNRKGKTICSECEASLPSVDASKLNSEIVRMIFLPRKSEGVSKSVRPLLNPQGIRDSPSGDESTEKVEETG